MTDQFDKMFYFNDLFYEGLIRPVVDASGSVERPWLTQRVEEALAYAGCRFLLLAAKPSADKYTFKAQRAAGRSDRRSQRSGESEAP